MQTREFGTAETGAASTAGQGDYAYGVNLPIIRALSDIGQQTIQGRGNGVTNGAKQQGKQHGSTDGGHQPAKRGATGEKL